MRKETYLYFIQNFCPFLMLFILMHENKEARAKTFLMNCNYEHLNKRSNSVSKLFQVSNLLKNLILFMVISVQEIYFYQTKFWSETFVKHLFEFTHVSRIILKWATLGQAQKALKTNLSVHNSISILWECYFGKFLRRKFHFSESKKMPRNWPLKMSDQELLIQISTLWR